MKEDTLYLIHIAECLDRIDTYAHGVDRQQFMQSTLTQDAILRNLQVLAESTQRLSDTFKSRHPEVESITRVVCDQAGWLKNLYR